jgi:Tfp pilus assembly protein PilO
MNKLIVISGILAVILLSGLLLVWPKYQNLQVVNFNVQQKQAELQSKEGYFALLKVASSTLAQYQEPLSKIASALPTDSSVPSLLNFLQSIAGQTGLLLERIDLGEIVSSEDTSILKEIRINLQLRGSYQSMKDFVSAAESSARLVEIEKLSFEAPADEEESPTIRIDVKASSY